MIVLLVLLAYVALCVVVCLFHRIISVVTMCGLGYAVYQIFFNHQFGIGLVILMLASFLSVLLAIASGEIEKGEVKEKKIQHVTGSAGNWIVYFIPIFWPFLIARAVLCGKTYKTDMTPYDYEQHLKCNAR